jgi:hypothetical protein
VVALRPLAFPEWPVSDKNRTLPSDLPELDITDAGELEDNPAPEPIDDASSPVMLKATSDAGSIPFVPSPNAILASSGRPLDVSTRTSMESGFWH